MKNMLRAVVVAAVLCVGLLAGCANTNQAASADAQEHKIKVVCATFPAYDWVTQVAGDRIDDFEITYLMDSGVDLHSYQPSVQDIAKISDADLFVYVGGESDGWAEDAVKAASNSSLRTVNMMEVLGDSAVEEEVVEGMQAEEEEAEASAEGEEEPEYDEHVWLSLKNAQELVDAIAVQLADADSSHASEYSANAAAYKAKLAELDGAYESAVNAAAKKTVVFADRFPFRYLVDDYNLGYYAAFVGCSAETEASFETIAFLAQKVDELGLSNVLVIENSDEAIAKTVIANTQGKNQGILVMDSLQSVTAGDIASGKTYLGAMEGNLASLTAALS